MSVEKRGPNSFRIRYGKNDEFSEPFKGNKTQARTRERELKMQYERGTAVHATHETVPALVERYIAHREAIGKVRPRTAEVYRGYVAREIGPRLGQLEATDARPGQLQRVLDESLLSGLSPRSVQQLFAIMRASFRWAVRMRIVAVNPCDGVTAPKVEQAKLVMPTPVDIAALVRAIDSSYRPPLLVAAGTGARRGEICGLRWEDVDLDGDRGRVRVEGTLQRGADGKLVRLAPKSQRSRRTIPLSETLTATLRAVRTEQLERRMQLGPAWHDTGFVFDSGSGSPLDPDALTRAFRAARKSAGLEGIRLHDLRHAFASLLVEGGSTDIRTVSDLLGHATVAFTLQAYVHPSAAAAETAIDDIERMLGGSSGR
jgi:integrase